MECFLVGYCGHAKRGNLGSYVNTGEARADRRTFIDKLENQFGK